jgi:hypothetical protein
MNRAITKGNFDMGKKYWTCISSDCRYRASGNAQQDRVYKHATGCEALGRTHPDVWQAIVDLQSGTSLGALLQQGSTSNSHSEPSSSRASSPVMISSAKKQKVEGPGKVWQWAREGGKVKKREEMERTQQLADHMIMQLICVRGLVPNILDSPEWTKLMHILNPNYNSTSAEKFSNKIIPKEAAFVRQEQLKVLQKSENITITFDGNSTRRDSIYFVHATTDQNSYFVEGHIGSDAHHTTKWITDRLLKVSTLSNHHVSYQHLFLDN